MRNWKFKANEFALFEKRGAIPRSIFKNFQSLFSVLDPFYEEEILKNIRISKYQTVFFFRYIFTTFFIPIIISNICKKVFFLPSVNYFWIKNDLKIFLNYTQEQRAYEELQNYNNELVFKKFLKTQHTSKTKNQKIYQKNLKIKAQKLAKKYLKESKEAISNILTDSINIFLFAIFLVKNQRQFQLFKSFLEELFYRLSDTARAFLIILFTDIFVGFHSSHGWEVFLELFLRHLGLPENRDFIYSFVATLPVILDAIFKYWIFRYLNQLSPSTVATYKNMNE